MNYMLQSFLIALCILCIILFVNNQYEIPKIAWFYWDAELPKLIQQIKDHNKSALKGWTVHYLNEKTVYDYIPRSAFPAKYEDLILQHKADWIRAYLLMTYGGCWIDASLILNDPECLNKLRDESYRRRSDFTGFYSTEKFIPTVSGTPISPNIENWFFMVPLNSRIMRLWYEEFTGAIDEGLLEYRDRIRDEGVNLDEYFKAGYDTNIYFSQHFCMQAILQKKLLIIPPMLLLSSGTHMFKIKNECIERKDISKCIMDRLVIDPATNQLLYIKLTGSERATKIDITPFFERSRVSKFQPTIANR